MSGKDALAKQRPFVSIIAAANRSSQDPGRPEAIRGLIVDCKETLLSFCDENYNRLVDVEIVIELIDAAFMIGLFASEENAARVLVQNRRREAGKAGARVRRAKAEAGWRAHARELAVQIRSEKLDWSREKVASEVQARWKAEDFEPPGHRTVVSFVTSLENAGDLLPKARSPRSLKF